MAKRKTTKSKRKAPSQELDSVYVLKIVMYLILGSLWIRITTVGGMQIPIPIGAIVGLLFATHDHFKIDRKIEYAVLLMSMFVGFWLPMGIDIVL